MNTAEWKVNLNNNFLVPENYWNIHSSALQSLNIQKEVNMNQCPSCILSVIRPALVYSGCYKDINFKNSNLRYADLCLWGLTIFFQTVEKVCHKMQHWKSENTTEFYDILPMCSKNVTQLKITPEVYLSLCFTQCFIKLYTKAKQTS